MATPIVKRKAFQLTREEAGVTPDMVMAMLFLSLCTLIIVYDYVLCCNVHERS